MKKKIEIILAALLLLFPARFVSAAEIEYGRAFVDNGRIFINFAVKSYQRNDIIEAIKRGIEVKITYEIEILKENPLDLLIKNIVLSKKVKRSVKYDYWNRAFIIREGKKSQLCNSEDSLLESFFALQDYDLVEASFIKGREYQLRARVTLHSVELFFPINFIFKFVGGLWDFETSWKEGPHLYELR